MNNPALNHVPPHMKMRTLAACASLAVLLGACGSSAGSSAGAPGTAAPGVTTAAGGDDVIVIEGYKFPPITAAAGAKLTFESRDAEAHTVTSDDGLFKISPISPKTSQVLDVPTTAGSYPFHCEFHPTMHGTLVVHNP